MKLIKRLWWLFRHPVERKKFNISLRVHLRAIREYQSFRVNFRHTKKWLSNKQLTKRRKAIREAKWATTSTAERWLNATTGIPWIR